MPDEKDESVKEELSELQAGTDWGEDWESAFQAEDEFFFSEEGDITDFPLDDHASSPDPPSNTPPPSANQQSPAIAGPDDETVISNTLADNAAQQLPGKLAQLTTKIIAFYYSNRAKFLEASLAKKILAGGAFFSIIILIGSAAIIFTLSGETSDKNDLETAPAISSTAAQQETAEKIRTKWLFADFLIPTSSEDKDTPTVFIDVSMTLVVLLDADESLPEDQKPFLRDLIYQFFSNRPFHEVKRFSLARGEMKRKLKDWIRKQWPTGDLETIIFNRYRVS